MRNADRSLCRPMTAGLLRISKRTDSALDPTGDRHDGDVRMVLRQSK